MCNHERVRGRLSDGRSQIVEKVLWASLRLHFESDDPAETQKVFGNGRTGRSVSSSPRRTIHLTALEV